MKKLGILFFILLAVLTFAVLGCLTAWLWTKNDVLLYVTVGLFPVYLFHLVFGLMHGNKKAKRDAAEERSFRLLSERDDAVVYVTYLGGKRGVLHPSRTKKDYLTEFYDEQVDLSLLKRHLWFDLPEEREKELQTHMIGGAKVPYPRLAELKNRRILVQIAFFDAAKDAPAFEQFFRDNEIMTYGE